MKLHIVLDLSDLEKKKISVNSIERTINHSIKVAELSSDSEWNVVVEDWEELKSITTKIWWCIQDAIFRQNNNMEEQS